MKVLLAELGFGGPSKADSKNLMLLRNSEEDSKFFRGIAYVIGSVTGTGTFLSPSNQMLLHSIKYSSRMEK